MVFGGLIFMRYTRPRNHEQSSTYKVAVVPAQRQYNRAQKLYSTVLCYCADLLYYSSAIESGYDRRSLRWLTSSENGGGAEERLLARGEKYEAP